MITHCPPTVCSAAYETLREYGLGDLLREHRRSRPHRVAVVDAHHRFTSYKKPKIVVFSDTLPRTPTGAIDRAAADALYGGGNYPSAG
jgi:acyl-CoA synthetase (AMP-forming)/AMP-acid ligase II